MENLSNSNGDGSGKCPFAPASKKHTTAGAYSNSSWWPNQLNLRILHQNSSVTRPTNKDFNYSAEFKSLDLDVLKKDLYDLMTGRIWVFKIFVIWNPIKMMIQGFMCMKDPSRSIHIF